MLLLDYKCPHCDKPIPAPQTWLSSFANIFSFVFIIFGTILLAFFLHDAFIGRP